MEIAKHKITELSSMRALTYSATVSPR